MRALILIALALVLSDCTTTKPARFSNVEKGQPRGIR